MAPINRLSIIVAFLIIGVYCESDKEELVAVAAIFRHGARTMIFPEYFEVANDTFLTEGNGILTKIGKRQHYLAGKQLFNDYGSLIDYTYSPKTIRVHASGLNRTIESVESLLFGFFEPGNGSQIIEIQNKNVTPPIRVEGIEEIRKNLSLDALPNRQQPVPIHTTLEKNDIYYESHNVCPGFKKYNKKIENEIKKLEEDFIKDIKVINESLPNNLKLKDKSTNECYKFFDNVLVVNGNGKNLSFNLTDSIAEKLDKCSISNSLRSFLGGKDKPMIAGYHLLKRVKNQFELVHDGSSLRKKIEIYLMSDVHIMAFHRLFDWPLTKSVPFASGLILEMYKNKSSSGGYNFKVSYNSKPIKLKNNSYNALMKSMENALFKNDQMFLKACKEGPIDPVIEKDYSAYKIVALILFGMFLFIWGLSWYCSISGKKKTESAESDLLIEDG